MKESNEKEVNELSENNEDINVNEVGESRVAIEGEENSSGSGESEESEDNKPIEDTPFADTGTKVEIESDTETELVKTDGIIVVTPFGRLEKKAISAIAVLVVVALIIGVITDC